jgi:hypothetical protein
MQQAGDETNHCPTKREKNLLLVIQRMKLVSPMLQGSRFFQQMFEMISDTIVVLDHPIQTTDSIQFIGHESMFGQCIRRCVRIADEIT